MDLVIKHKDGHTNINADALSRNPTPDVCIVSAMAGESPSTEIIEEISAAQKGNSELMRMFQYLEQNVLPLDE